MGGDIFGYQVRVRVSSSDPRSEGRPHLWNGEAVAPRLFELDESHEECWAGRVLDGGGEQQQAGGAASGQARGAYQGHRGGLIVTGLGTCATF